MIAFLLMISLLLDFTLKGVSCFVDFICIYLFFCFPVNIKFCSVVRLLNLQLSATWCKDLIVSCKGCARQNGKLTRSLTLLSTMNKASAILRLISLTLSSDACVKRPVYFHHQRNVLSPEQAGRACTPSEPLRLVFFVSFFLFSIPVIKCSSQHNERCGN